MLDLYDQCTSLPVEISQLSLYSGFLLQTFLNHGCWTLNQFQRLMRIGGRPDPTSVIELLMLQIDEQGLEDATLRAHGKCSLTDCLRMLCSHNYETCGIVRRPGWAAVGLNRRLMRTSKTGETKPGNVSRYSDDWGGMRFSPSSR